VNAPVPLQTREQPQQHLTIVFDTYSRAKKANGFRTQEAYETALYHNLGALPVRKFTHEFL